MLDKYKKTIIACCISYVTQAIVVNFPPLLFVQLSRQYSISLSQISVLISVCFGVQLAVDAIAARIDTRLNYRAVAILSQICAVIGIGGIAVLPSILPAPFVGLVIAQLFAGVGGGLMEVIISPIVEACPSSNKTGTMSIMHSFYCWGQALTVLLTTVILALVSIERWWVAALLWTVVPICSLILFSFVPIPQEDEKRERATLPETPEKASASPSLLKNGTFYVFVLVMICAGAAELSMAQWASSFAETGLKVSKALGDVLGPCLFAVAMGTARLLFARLTQTRATTRFMLISAILCAVSYLITALSPIPLLSLFGCALCGFSVGSLWPGSLSLAARRLSGSVAVFALMALAGDLGALIGPSITGALAEKLGGDIGSAFLFSLVFPAILIVVLTIQYQRSGKEDQK